MRFYQRTVPGDDVLIQTMCSRREFMSSSTITLLFLGFAVIMFVLEKIPLGVTSWM